MGLENQGVDENAAGCSKPDGPPTDSDTPDPALAPMKNFIQPSIVLDFIAPVGGVVSGVGYVVGNRFFVATTTAAAGALVPGARVGTFRLPKNATEAATAHQIAYWDDTAKAVRNATGAGRFIIGTINETRLAADTYADVTLDGTLVVAI